MRLLEIRRARNSDAAGIHEVTAQAFETYARQMNIPGTMDAQAETMEDIERDIENKFVIVAIVRDKVAGSVRLDIRPDNTAYLSRFGVANEYQRIGLGKVLMNMVDIAMRERNVEAVELHTASQHLPLISLYYSFGYYIASTSDDKGYIRALLRKKYF